MDTAPPAAAAGRIGGRQRLVRHGNVGSVVRPVDRPRPARSVGVLPWVALGVVYVLWGSTYLANRLIIATVPPLFLGGVRFLIGGALLGAGRARGRRAGGRSG